MDTKKCIDRSLYDVHVILDKNDLKKAHFQSKLDVKYCDYFLPVNFGVLMVQERTFFSFFKRVVRFVLIRLSFIIFLIEKYLFKLPVTRTFSPYIFCVAKKK